MKSFLVGLCALALVACITPTNSPSWSDLRRMPDPVVTVQILGENGNASAVMVAPNRAVTAAHVVQMDKLTIDGKPVMVLKVDELADVAYLKVDRDCPCAPVAQSAPVVDEAVTLVGFPIADTLNNLQVKVFGHFLFDLVTKQQGEDRVFSIYYGFSAPGSSGGGVFNSKGELVGIISGIPAMPGGMFGSPQFLFNIVAASPLKAIQAIING